MSLKTFTKIDLKHLKFILQIKLLLGQILNCNIKIFSKTVSTTNPYVVDNFIINFRNIYTLIIWYKKYRSNKLCTNKLVKVISLPKSYKKKIKPNKFILFISANINILILIK